MDRREVGVRAYQEFHKQRDLLLHRLSIRQDRVQIRGEQKAHPAHFFFDDGDASSRASLILKYLPEQANSIVHEADEICAHKFRLLGYENLTFPRSQGDGSAGEINWHLDAVHGKRAPLIPWFTIPFLDFAVVGDHKVTWELNRHQHLPTLAKAWLLSGDNKYLTELIAQWHSWIEANPYPLGINWGSSLEVAFRSFSWIWIDRLLAHADASHKSTAWAEFTNDLAASLAFHGRYIERYLSTYFSPNTHLLGEAAALFFLGTLYPEMPHASRWKETGWSVVLDAAQRQVRPDGVYFEQSLYYHVYALDFFLHARLLAERNGIAIPPAYDATVQKMLDVVEAVAQGGFAEGFGDDDGGRLFNPRRNHTKHLTDPLALGSLVYARNSSGAQLTEESIWLFGERAVEMLARSRPSAEVRSEVRSVAFPDGGVYVLADSQPFPQVMTVDAGPQGIGRSGHGHADALSIRLTMNGQRWLVDSGSGVYISNDQSERDTFRGTGAHNTMRVDGQDQAIADEPFSWTHIPTAKAERWIAGKTFSYFVGSHNGYERLENPATHRRYVLNIAGGLWLIRDVASGVGEHEIEIRWHFAPGLEVRPVSTGRIDVIGNNASMTLFVPKNTSWQNAAEVTKTTLSPAYGALQPSLLVASKASVKLPTELATVLISEPALSLADDYSNQRDESGLDCMAEEVVQVYKLADRTATHEFFFARSDQDWSSGPWSSDAQLLYCRMAHEKIGHLVVVGGTKVAWHGQPLIKSSGPSEYFEWRAEGSVMSKGGFSLTELFGALTGSESSPECSSRDQSSFVEKD